MNKKELVQFAFRTQEDKKAAIQKMSEACGLDMGSMMNLILDQVLYDLDYKILLEDNCSLVPQTMDGVYELLRKLNEESIKELKNSFARENHITRQGGYTTRASNALYIKTEGGKVIISKRNLFGTLFVMMHGHQMYSEFSKFRKDFIINEAVKDMINKEGNYEYERYYLEEMKNVKHINIYYYERYIMCEEIYMEESTGTYRVSEIEVVYLNDKNDYIYDLDCLKEIFNSEEELEEAVREDLGNYNYKINFEEKNVML